MMRLRRRRWLWILGLPLFVGVAAHWGFHFYMRGLLNDLSHQLPSGAVFEYGDLRTSLLGRVEIEDARLVLSALPAPVAMGRIELQGPSVPAYLLRNNPITGFGPPRHLSYRFSGARLPLAGPVHAGEDGCELEQGLSLGLLREMGFRELPWSIRGEYGYRPAEARLQGSLTLDLGEIEHTRLRLRLQNVTDQGFRSGELATALLAELGLRVEIEPAFGRRLLRHCAARRQLTPAAFGDQLAERVLAELGKAGVLVNDELEEALYQYVRSWGSLELNLTPPVPLSLAFLPFVPPDQLRQKLGMELLVNGRLMEGVALQLASASQGKRSPVAARAPRLRRLQKRWGYRVVNPSELSRYLGHRARLQERGDPVRSGVLVEVRDGQAVLRQHIRGGEFLAYLSLDQLERAEVYLLQTVAAEKKF